MISNWRIENCGEWNATDTAIHDCWGWVSLVGKVLTSEGNRKLSNYVSFWQEKANSLERSRKARRMKCIWRIVDRYWRVSDSRFKESNVRQSGQSKYFERVISRKFIILRRNMQIYARFRARERERWNLTCPKHIHVTRNLFTSSLIVSRKWCNWHVLRALAARVDSPVVIIRPCFRGELRCTTFTSHLETVARRHNRFVLVIHRRRMIDEDKYEFIPSKILHRQKIFNQISLLYF